MPKTTTLSKKEYEEMGSFIEGKGYRCDKNGSRYKVVAPRDSGLPPFTSAVKSGLKAEFNSGAPAPPNPVSPGGASASPEQDEVGMDELLDLLDNGSPVASPVRPPVASPVRPPVASPVRPPARPPGDNLLPPGDINEWFANNVANRPSLAAQRRACKEQGLVLDKDTRQCRESRRRVGRRPKWAEDLSEAEYSVGKADRAAARRRAVAGQMAVLRAACKEQGLVLDAKTKKCREKASRKGRRPAWAQDLSDAEYSVGKADRAAARRRAVAGQMAMLRAACKEQGLVLDAKTKKCRAKASRKGRRPKWAQDLSDAEYSVGKADRAAARRRAVAGQMAMLRAACKEQGLVLDAKTKKCRAMASRKGRRAKWGEDMSQAEYDVAKGERAATRRRVVAGQKAALRDHCEQQGMMYNENIMDCE